MFPADFADVPADCADLLQIAQIFSQITLIGLLVCVICVLNPRDLRENETQKWISGFPQIAQMLPLIAQIFCR